MHGGNCRAVPVERNLVKISYSSEDNDGVRVFLMIDFHRKREFILIADETNGEHLG